MNIWRNYKQERGCYCIVLSQVDAASDGCGVQLSNNSPSPKYSTVSPAVDDDDCGRESSGHGVDDVSRPVNATQHASTSTEQTADRQVYQPTYSLTLWNVSNKCIAVRKVATLLRELTCHMRSHSYLPPGRCDIPALTPAEAGTRLSDPGGMQG